MKKLNLNNLTSGDDKDMIKYVRSSLKNEPSINFTNNTLFELSKSKPRINFNHKPLKTPLFIMVFLGLLLFVPILNLSGGWGSVNEQYSEFQELLIVYGQSENIWYWVSPILVILVIQVFILIEFRINYDRNAIG